LGAAEWRDNNRHHQLGCEAKTCLERLCKRHRSFRLCVDVSVSARGALQDHRAGYLLRAF